MPPRRSLRGATLPTPTDTPITSVSPTSATSTTGLQTPTSMTDDSGPALGAKRKATSPAGSPSAKRQHVKVDNSAPLASRPTRRSKLGIEQTVSADNLTLDRKRLPEEDNSPRTAQVKKEDDVQVKEEDDAIVISGDTTDVDIPELIPSRPTRRATRAAAPKYAESGSDSEDFKPATRKSKGKAKAIIEVSSDDDDTSDEFKMDDYALNSDDEDAQIQIAVNNSKSATRNGTTSSKGSSSKSTTTSRGRKTTSSSKATGKSSKPKDPRRAALLAAERRASGVQDSFSDDSDGLPTPLDTNSTAVPTPDGATEASDYSAASAWSDDSEEEPLWEKRGKKSKKAKGKKKGTNGRRLDGEEGDEMPEHWSKPRRERMQALEKERQRAKAEDAWIKSKERKLKKKVDRKLTQGEKNHIRLCLHHPELEDAWGDLAASIEPIKPVPMEAHPSLKLTLLPFQKESLYWMKKQEEGPWAGGMLADEMGMGKTIQTIALLLSEPRRKPSLVVAPVVALMQWKHEIETHAEGFTVCVWHGSKRVQAADLKKFDVVLVSYGTLEASYRRQQNGFNRKGRIIKEQSPMHAFEWYRVVLDEAHNIKERSTNAAKASFALKAKFRWCLSGTPLQNRVGELYSLVRFLGADPFSYYFCKKCDCKSLTWQFSDKRHCDDCGHRPMDHVSLWNSEILHPIANYGIEEGGPGKVAFKKLKILLDRMMLRRTKIERADDLGLPPRIITVRRDYFSPAEKEIYLSLFTNARRQFDTYLDNGTVLNNYSNIFSLITRMRQMACHPDLVLKSKTSTLAQSVDEGTVCRICNDAAEDAIVSACKHVFDRECIRQYLEVQQNQGHRPECPVCHIEISIDLEQETVEVEQNTKAARQGILSRLNVDKWRSSTKLEALVEELEKLRRKDCTIKSLVFSQFVSFLDLIAFRLQRAGFNICRLEGGMTPQQRDATIQHFMKNTQVTVFLISLKAGGVALNLTEASMVFMMDSWWNPSTEYQAMDRIHRLGQKRPVKVIKFVVQDSIEDQIVQLQAKKLAMTDAALSRDPDAALGKLTVEDLGFLFKL